MEQPIKKAMVLAAGFGKRMRPLTDHLPKPLIEVAGKTMLDRSLDQLYAAGVEEVMVNGHYLSGVLQEHLALRQRRQPTQPIIHYSHEEEILETGGGIAKVLDWFEGKPFFVINGDIIWEDRPGTSALHRLANHYQSCAASCDALLLLHEVTGAIGYHGSGDLMMDEAANLSRPTDVVLFPYVFTGISILHPRLFNSLETPPFSLSKCFAKDRDAEGHHHRIAGIKHEGAWLHIGTPAELKEAESYLQPC